MTQKKQFHCLRCGNEFLVDYDPKQVVERACPKCGSNSVRLESKAAAAQTPSVGARVSQGGER